MPTRKESKHLERPKINTIKQLRQKATPKRITPTQLSPRDDFPTKEGDNIFDLTQPLNQVEKPEKNLHMEKQEFEQKTGNDKTEFIEGTIPNKEEDELKTENNKPELVEGTVPNKEEDEQKTENNKAELLEGITRNNEEEDAKIERSPSVKEERKEENSQSQKEDSQPQKENSQEKQESKDVNVGELLEPDNLNENIRGMKRKDEEGLEVENNAKHPRTVEN